MLELLKALVSINSVNPSLERGAPGEASLAHFIADWLSARGLEVHLEEVAPGRPNVIAVARGSGGGRSLLLGGHSDTVGVSGMAQPFQPRQQGNRLYGRGALDMKAGLAAAMLAVARAKDFNLHGDVIFAATADEEYGSIGMEALGNWQADAAIITEPTWMKLCTAHRGFAVIEVQTQGTAVHTSQQPLGVNAITLAGRVLAGIEALNQALESRPAHPLLAHGSIQATLISGGEALFTSPTHCSIWVERRTLPGETRESIEGEIQALLDQLAQQDPRFKASWRTVIAREPYEIPAESPIARLLANHTKEHTGQAPEIFGAPYWMESALLGARGIPTVIFGPGGEGLHSQEEWVRLEDVAACAEILEKVIWEFCG